VQQYNVYAYIFYVIYLNLCVVMRSPSTGEPRPRGSEGQVTMEVGKARRL